MKKQNTLDQIDAYFARQPKNIFGLALVAVVGILGYLIYDYSFESSEQYLSQETNARDKAQKWLDDLISYIELQERNNTIANLQNQIEYKKDKIAELDSDNAFFDEKLREVSKVLNNQENWSNFIAKASQSASRHNLAFNQLSSLRNNPAAQQVQEAFNADFALRGSFAGILLFINDLERSLDVVDVKNVSIERSEARMYVPKNNAQRSYVMNPTELSAVINVAIWGIKF